MGRARDDVSNILVFGQNLRQSLNYIFDSLIRREQAESEQDRFSLNTKAVFVEIGIQEWQVWNSMRHHVDLATRHLEDFLQELGRQLAHDNEAVRQLHDLFHDHRLVGVWFAQNCMQGCHHGHLQGTQQMQNMASGRTTEDSILVLQTHHVDVVEVQEFGGLLIRLHFILRERPSHPGGIIVTFLGVVDRER